MTRPKVSAFIATHNEEVRIRTALESVKWCDEIVVVDDNSTDRTKEVCREYTDKVFNRKWGRICKPERLRNEPDHE